VAIAALFQNTFTADPNVAVTGNAFTSSVLVRYGADGAHTLTSVFDSNGFCELRAIALDDDAVVLSGSTQGTLSVPQYGACSIATNRQDPVAIRVDAQGTQTLVSHWVANAQNAQTWAMTAMADGTFTLFGIYSGGLTIGANVLPTAQADPNAWIARTAATPSDATWSEGLSAALQIHPSKIATSGDDVCIVGAHQGAVSLFGTAVPYVAGYDAWVARLDGSGNDRFVRGFGSTGNEPSFGNETSLVALPDGGCLAAIVSPADITLDATTYAVADGRGFVVRFAADGSVAWARRTFTDPMITMVGTRILGAFTVSGTVMIGSTPYIAQGSSDVVVVELDPTGANDRLLGSVTGTGAQTARELVAIGPDVVAVTVSSSGGTLEFGSNTSASNTRAVAVLGI
jgi:hypothetical protein